jgi:hypothetical protein
MTPQHLPAQGVLQLEFASDKRPSLDCEPLTDEVGWVQSTVVASWWVSWFFVGCLAASLGSPARPYKATLLNPSPSPQDFDSLWVAMTDPTRLTQAAADLALSCAPGTIVSPARRPPAAAAPLAALAGSSQHGGAINSGGGGSTVAKAAAARGTVAIVLPAPAAGGRPAGGSHVRAVTDGWKLDLLSVLVCDCYFTARQSGAVVSGFHYGEDRVQAAVKMFGRVVDPERFAAEVCASLTPGQVRFRFDSRMGVESGLVSTAACCCAAASALLQDGNI